MDKATGRRRQRQKKRNRDENVNIDFCILYLLTMFGVHSSHKTIAMDSWASHVQPEWCVSHAMLGIASTLRSIEMSARINRQQEFRNNVKMPQSQSWLDYLWCLISIFILYSISFERRRMRDENIFFSVDTNQQQQKDFLVFLFLLRFEFIIIEKRRKERETTMIPWYRVFLEVNKNAIKLWQDIGATRPCCTFVRSNFED